MKKMPYEIKKKLKNYFFGLLIERRNNSFVIKKFEVEYENHRFD